MTELEVKRLQHLAFSWPWRWTKIGKQTAQLCEEWLKLQNQNASMTDGMATMFEFIRRTKGIDQNGQQIPNIFKR